jgi:hypothetical protein
MRYINLYIDVDCLYPEGELIYVNRIFEEAKLNGYCLMKMNITEEIICKIKYIILNKCNQYETSNLIGPLSDLTIFSETICLINSQKNLILKKIYCKFQNIETLKNYEKLWNDSNISNWVETTPDVYEIEFYKQLSRYKSIEYYSKRNNVEFNYVIN